jgi:bifunctional NMN adenylyltransferase/nudix hydrolase
MTKQFDAIVFNGRFQPLHLGHIDVIRRAGELAEKVFVIVGSSHQPRSFKNPFTFRERKQPILMSCSGLVESLRVIPNYDTLNNDDTWADNVYSLVSEETEYDDKIAIIGHKKDDSSFYLDMFPKWELVEVPLFDNLSATPIRELYFTHAVNPENFKLVLPEPTIEFLTLFKETQEYLEIVRERASIEKYKSQYEMLPFPPTFVTVDALVVHNRHVLMVERKNEPGRGLWALPGGFLDARTDRSLEAAMFRELKEETHLDITGRMMGTHVFDSVDRSSRGRTITHAFHMVIDSNLPRPEVIPGDDAKSAAWIPAEKINPSKCFEDHYEIINHFLRIRDITNYFEEL